MSAPPGGKIPLDIFFCYSILLDIDQVLIIKLSLIGNPVRIGDGPAAVIGDESCNMSLAVKAGKAQPVGRSESQKTCLSIWGNGS